MNIFVKRKNQLCISQEESHMSYFRKTEYGILE